MPEFLPSRTDTTRLTKRDKWAVCILTLLYTLFALINLGTMNFPQNEWTAAAGESVTLDLGAVREVYTLRVNGNIAEGRLLIAGDDGSSYELEEKFGEMFSWRDKSSYFSARYMYLTVLSGTISLNEIAFLDAQGDVLPVSVAAGDGAALVDEQDTVPAEPNCRNGMYFDEIYHARTAYEFLHGMSVYEWTHPPLGKIIIALGVLLFGMTPFGWRFMPTLFGGAMLPLMYLLGKRLFRRSDLAFCAAAIFAFDTMHYTQTRIATVDVFIVFFVLLMYLFMTDYLQTDLVGTPLKKQLRPLGACGVSFGLGVASKWTGLYAGLGLALLFFGKLVITALRVRNDREASRVFYRNAWKTILFCCGFFLLIPALIYYLSYIPFYRYEAAHAPGQYGFAGSIRTIMNQQRSMYSYHSGLTATHTCQSAWYQWPFADKGVWFYSKYISASDSFSEIVSIGSFAVWWVAATGVFCLCTEGVFGGFKKESREKRLALVILLVAMAANFLPWVTVPRCIFLYHFFPTLPFMILGALLIGQKLEEEGKLPLKAKWIWLAAAAVCFVLMLPGISGLKMSRAYATFLEYILPGGQMFYGTV